LKIEYLWMSLRSVMIKMERIPQGILGFSASSFILTLKYILPQYAQNSVLPT